jgi:hypothetical protein
MNEVVDLLDPHTVDRQRRVLKDKGLSRYSDLHDETLAALTYLGRHPAKLRAATMAIVTTTAREDMYAYRLAEYDDHQRIRWTLTDKGDEIADLLASTVSRPSEADEQLARERYAALLERASKALED